MSNGKKKLTHRLEQCKAEYPELEVEVWAMDEHRVGLQPCTQRGWSPKGQRTVEWVRPGYKWRYVWAWVRPATGEMDVWLTTNVNTQVHNVLLKHLGHTLKLGVERRVILVVDSAGWHTSKSLELPEGLELFYLPASTPELQPAERLWSLFDEPLIGLAASEIEQVEQVLETRSNWLMEHPEVVRNRAHFRWWPEPRMEAKSLTTN